MPIHPTLAFVDVETTGLDPRHHEILEIAILRVELGKPLTTWHGRYAPEHPERATPEALAVNGIDLANWPPAPLDAYQVRGIHGMFRDATMVGHNIAFDGAFLDTLFARHGLPRVGYHRLDTVTLAFEHLVPCGLTSLKLTAICEHLGISNDGAHSAMADARRCMTVYQALASRVSLYGRAVGYVLDRRQTDPDLGYLIGPHTEAFERLCEAEAAFLHIPVEDVQQERLEDRQPPHRKRRADVLVLRERVEELERQLEEAQR